MKQNNRIYNIQFIKKYSMIILGTILYSAGISIFLDPNRIAPGGVVGLSIVASHTIGGATGFWYLLINIPIMMIGLFKFGYYYIIDCFFAILCNSGFTNIFSTVPVITNNPFLAASIGSILVGTGLGIVLRAGASTGGTDVIVKVLRKKYPSIKTSTFFFVIDTIIVIFSGFVFRDFNIALYSFITVILNERVLDYILYGGDEANLIYIVSNQSNQVLKRILEELEIGATILSGHGAYSKTNKDIIMCVIRKRNAPRLENIVKEEDEKAFMIVTRANEIYGEGYKNILLDKI